MHFIHQNIHNWSFGIKTYYPCISTALSRIGATLFFTAKQHITEIFTHTCALLLRAVEIFGTDTFTTFEYFESFNACTLYILVQWEVQKTCPFTLEFESKQSKKQIQWDVNMVASSHTLCVFNFMTFYDIMIHTGLQTGNPTDK